MLLSKCSVRNSKKLKFTKEQEAGELLSSLGIRTPLSQILLLGPVFFRKYKMNEIKSKFSSVGNKFMPKVHLI